MADTLSEIMGMSNEELDKMVEGFIGKPRKEVEAELAEIRQRLQEVSDAVPLKGNPGPQGERGPAGANGLNGKDGKAGKDGRDGLNGKNGKDGIDGKDGADGVSVVNAYLDFDNSLTLELSDGSVIDAGQFNLPESIQNVIQSLKQTGPTTLDTLSDVNVASATNAQVLTYDAASGKWIPTTVSGAGGGGSGTVTSVAATGGTGISITGSPITSSGTLTITNTAPDQVVALTGAGTTSVSGTYPNFTITSNDAYTGTVTSVTGTAPISSTGGATPAISISQATTSTDGYLSSIDWNTFNNKQPAGTYVTSVGGTGVISSSGGTTPTISISQATTSTSGYLSSTDWNTFNGKYSVGGALGTPLSGTLTNCTGLPIGGISATGTPSSTTYLRGDGTWSTVAGGGSPAGANTQVQYNNAGAFGASSSFTFDGVNLTSPEFVATASTSASATSGAFAYGTLGYSDTNVMASFQSSVNSYNQVVLQNTNAGAAASTNFNVSNNASTATTNYGEFGINSSAFTGTGAFGGAGNVYLASASTDLAIGTYGANAIHFVTNSGATDAGSISSAGKWAINASGTNTTATALLHLGAGTASANTAPLKFTSGTNLTTAEAGSFEYDGTLPFFTPFGASRGIMPSEQFIVLGAPYTLASQTAAQKMFNNTTNGAVTLAVGTYYFECQFSLSTLSGTSGSFGFAMAAGTAVIGSQAWTSTANKVAFATPSTAQSTFNTAANTLLASNSTNTVGYAIIRGVIRITTGGTVIPSVSTTVATATATVNANSYFRIYPISSTGTSNITVGNWS